MECDYVVGHSLHFVIAGIGEEDATISFMSSSFEGDYYGGVTSHGCVIVHKGGLNSPSDVVERLNRFADLAFVSPRDGKVYRNALDCAEARGVK
jgi:hypothetical protein